MDCREVRDLADAYVSEQVLVETARAIVAHLGRCPACHAEVDGLRRLRVVLVAGGGFGIRGLGVSGFTAILQAAVGDHRFCLVAFKLAERPIALEKAAELYGDPVDRSLDTVQAPSTQLSGGPVRIVERHSCVFGGRRFAHIVLRYKRELISLVVTPDERLLRNLPGASAPRDGSIVSLPLVDGYHVAAFRGPRHVVFAISGLDDHDLREVTRSMVGSVSRALRD
jgi:Putative zinc-finger